MAAPPPKLNRIPGGVSGAAAPPAADEMQDLLEKWESEAERLREATEHLKRLRPKADEPADAGEGAGG